MIIGGCKFLQYENREVGVGEWVSCGKAPYIFRKCIILHYHVTTIIPGELFSLLRNGLWTLGAEEMYNRGRGDIF